MQLAKNMGLEKHTPGQTITVSDTSTIDLTLSASNVLSGTFIPWSTQTMQTQANAVNFATGANTQMTTSAVTNFASTQSHTYLLWFYPTANNTNTTSMIDFGGGGAGTSMTFYFPASGNHQINLYNNGTAITYSAAGIFTMNTWHHLAVTYNSATGAVKIYKNGTHVNGSQSTAQTWSSRSYALQIGMSTAFGSRVADGRFDEVRIYNSLLSDADISTDYNSGNGTRGTSGDAGILYGWHCDEGSGTTATSYATSLNATLVQSSWAAGKVGGASFSQDLLYIPSITGIPTSTPTSVSNQVPIMFETNTKKIYLHDGTSWIATAALS